MENEITRRGFLKKSVITMGTVAAYHFSFPCRAEQLSKSKNSASADNARSANLSEAPIASPQTGAVKHDKIKEKSNMKICLTAGDTVLTATMRDNETSRDFISLLPLTLTLKDYAGTEKISELPKRLSTQGAPSGSDPSVGEYQNKVK